MQRLPWFLLRAIVVLAVSRVPDYKFSGSATNRRGGGRGGRPKTGPESPKALCEPAASAQREIKDEAENSRSLSSSRSHHLTVPSSPARLRATSFVSTLSLALAGRSGPGSLVVSSSFHASRPVNPPRIPPRSYGDAPANLHTRSPGIGESSPRSLTLSILLLPRRPADPCFSVFFFLLLFARPTWPRPARPDAIRAALGVRHRLRLARRRTALAIFSIYLPRCLPSSLNARSREL